jgi:hypothetical protein
MKAIGARTLKEIGDSYREFDVIGIDEGQFFPDVSKNSLNKSICFYQTQAELFDKLTLFRLWNGQTKLPTEEKS